MNNVATYALLGCNIFVVSLVVQLFGQISCLTWASPQEQRQTLKISPKHIVGFLLTIWQICFSLYRLKCRHHLSLPIPAFSKYFLSFLTLVNLSQIVGLLNILNKWRTSINTLPFFVCEKILRRYKCAVTALIRNGSGR